jgi:hypothetical protein
MIADADTRSQTLDHGSEKQAATVRIDSTTDCGTRLPSFNDFSPGLIPDIRQILALVDGAPTDEIITRIPTAAPTVTVLQRRKNVLITLASLGFVERDGPNVSITPTGKEIRDAPDRLTAIRTMCRHVIEKRNGFAILRAVDALDRSDTHATKKSLQRQLELDGITDLSNATTDHTTLANWMCEAGLLKRTSQGYRLSEHGMNSALGFGTADLAAMEKLTEQQRLFARELKRRSIIQPEEAWMQAGEVFDACAAMRPALFNNHDQMRAKVTLPLEEAGWIEFDHTKSKGTGRGGKGGWIRPGKTLNAIPVDDLLPQYLDLVPNDLRAKLSTPPSLVRAMLPDPDTGVRGLGLELVALRMAIDLGLRPAGFRLRASETTGGTEIDLMAEDRHRGYILWTFQCKNTASNVTASHVAKEVGIATTLRSHIIVMVSTAGFSRPALDYAAETARNTPLQFIFIDGDELGRYLEHGADWLVKHVSRCTERTARIKTLRDAGVPAYASA